MGNGCILLPRELIFSLRSTISFSLFTLFSPSLLSLTSLTRSPIFILDIFCISRVVLLFCVEYSTALDGVGIFFLITHD